MRIILTLILLSTFGSNIVSAADYSSYKVEFFDRNGNWKGNMTGISKKDPYNQFTYRFSRLCNPPVVMYAPGTGNNYAAASANKWDYKIYKDGKRIC